MLQWFAHSCQYCGLRGCEFLWGNVVLHFFLHWCVADKKGKALGLLDSEGSCHWPWQPSWLTVIGSEGLCEKAVGVGT